MSVKILQSGDSAPIIHIFLTLEDAYEFIRKPYNKKLDINLVYMDLLDDDGTRWSLLRNIEEVDHTITRP